MEGDRGFGASGTIGPHEGRQPTEHGAEDRSVAPHGFSLLVRELDGGCKGLNVLEDFVGGSCPHGIAPQGGG